MNYQCKGVLFKFMFFEKEYFIKKWLWLTMADPVETRRLVQIQLLQNGFCQAVSIILGVTVKTAWAE